MKPSKKQLEKALKAQEKKDKRAQASGMTKHMDKRSMRKQMKKSHEHFQSSRKLQRR